MTTDQVKRPVNAFILYRRSKVKELNLPSDINTCKYFAKLWNEEPESVKNIFRKESKELFKKHKQEHPDFKWVTRRRPLAQLNGSIKTPKPGPLPVPVSVWCPEVLKTESPDFQEVLDALNVLERWNRSVDYPTETLNQQFGQSDYSDLFNFSPK